MELADKILLTYVEDGNMIEDICPFTAMGYAPGVGKTFAAKRLVYSIMQVFDEQTKISDWSAKLRGVMND